jgi:hypothetical protein
VQTPAEQHRLFQQYCTENYELNGQGLREVIPQSAPENFPSDSDELMEDAVHDNHNPYMCCGDEVSHHKHRLPVPIPCSGHSSTHGLDGHSSEKVSMVADGLAKLDRLAAFSFKVPRVACAGTSQINHDGPDEMDWVYDFTPASAREV